MYMSDKDTEYAKNTPFMDPQADVETLAFNLSGLIAYKISSLKSRSLVVLNLSQDPITFARPHTGLFGVCEHKLSRFSCSCSFMKPGMDIILPKQSGMLAIPMGHPKLRLNGGPRGPETSCPAVDFTYVLGSDKLDRGPQTA